MRSRVSLERYFSLYVSISRDNTFEKDKQCNARADFFLSSLSSKKMKKYRHREENTKTKQQKMRTKRREERSTRQTHNNTPLRWPKREQRHRVLARVKSHTGGKERSHLCPRSTKGRKTFVWLSMLRETM